MIVYAATSNAGKLRELRAIFASSGWQIVAYDGYAAPVEGDRDYAENSALKARALRAALSVSGVPFGAVVADDSGIEVASLGGRPGVVSARYGGDSATWSERRRMLLEELDATGSADRGARFVCAMHLIDDAGREVSARGEIAGCLAHAERGDGGFSYDAIFELPEDGRTFAELSEEEKNAISHRALAAKALLAVRGKSEEAAAGCSSAR